MAAAAACIFASGGGRTSSAAKALALCHRVRRSFIARISGEDGIKQTAGAISLRAITPDDVKRLFKLLRFASFAPAAA